MSNATATPATARVFGRCPEKGCTTRIVLDPATDARVRPVTTRGKLAAVEYDAAPRTELADGAAFVGGGGMIYCATKHGGHVASGLPAHHVRIAWRGVKATLNTMDCGPQCWDATGADCKCSCGGARHGELA